MVVHALLTAHETDPLRFDVVVPDQQYMYLKAFSTSERQLWMTTLTHKPTAAPSSSASGAPAKPVQSEKEMVAALSKTLRKQRDSLMQHVLDVEARIQLMREKVWRSDDADADADADRGLKSGQRPKGRD